VIGPVLVVADNDAIARRAPRWAEAFAAEGRLHRVRLVGSGSDREIAAVEAEARSLAAGGILAAGREPARTVATAVAARLGLPLVESGADGDTEG